MHYHRATLQAIEARLFQLGIGFRVLSAQDNPGATGRVAESRKVVARHEHFRLGERRLGNFQLRLQHGLVDKIQRQKPALVVSTCHSGTVTEWQMLRWARQNGVRCIAWQCGYEYNPGKLKRFVLKRFVPQFNFHLCYHSNAKNYAIQHGAGAEQTLVMHNTIDERAISAGDPVLAKAALQDKYPQLAGKKIVLYVGAVLALSLIHI